MRVYPRRHKSQVTWCADLRVVDPHTGRVHRKRPALRGVHSRAEAERVAAEVQARLDRMSSQASPDDVCFDEFAQRWLQDCGCDWSPNTFRVYEQHVRVHLIPWFRDMPLRSIGVAEVQRYKAAKMAEDAEGRKLKPKTVANQLATLSSLFDSALVWEMVQKNPVRKVKRPEAGPESDVAVPWKVEEARRFLAFVHLQEPKWLPLFWFAMRTGLRQGELAALTWEDIDFERCLVHVKENLSNGSLRRPKNKRKRYEPLPRELVSIMLQHRAQSANKKVFLARDGRDLTRNRIKSVYFRCIRDSGVPRIRFHDLRHTFGKHLASYSGASARVLQELMGHTDSRSTKRYTMVDSEDKRTAVEKLPSLQPGSMATEEALGG